MKTLTAYRVFGRLNEEKYYSKIIHIDESNYSNQSDINEAIDDIAITDWSDGGENWLREESIVHEGFEVYRIAKL